MKKSENNLAFSIYAHASTMGDQPAVVAGTETLDYAMFATGAAGMAAGMRNFFATGRIGILASRSRDACLGIIAATWAGGTYVPLGLKLPEERLIALLNMLDLDALVVDRQGASRLTDRVLSAAPGMIFAPADCDISESGGRTVVETDSVALNVPGDCLPAPAAVADDHVAYIEFTSGSTGVPKGVMVSVGAVNSYLDVTQNWFRFGPDDRAAETCDITFDLSAHNMFAAWRAGAALYLMQPLEMLAPAQFVRKHGITTWLSVPSVAAMMRRNGTLNTACMPSLRLSLFCGEPLPASVAVAWQEAAPNSVVENIYGPTEATIACLRQPWSEGGRVTHERGVVAIGEPYPGMEAAIVDASGHPLPPGSRGEIALSGAQLAEGYFQQPELSLQRFPTIDGKRWYLTGDLGMADADGVFHHLGRLDNQVKIHGHRVELEEIEAALRQATGVDLVAAVAWPVLHGSAEGVVAFCTPPVRPMAAVMDDLKRALPAYMVPQRLEPVETMPLNANGKVDRKALLARLEAVAA